MQVLFLCTGNTCRSPMAAALFASTVQEYAVASAGLCAAKGQPAATHMQALAPSYGLDLSAHKSTPASPALLAAADALVCLSANHARALAASVPAKKLHILGGGIADPFGGSLEEYRACTAQMAAALPALAATLRSPAHVCPTEEPHLPALAALEAQLFHPPASAARLREKFLLPHCHMQTALKNGKIVGFIDVDEIAGEAFVDDLAVDGAHQRQGIGSALLARAETGAAVRGCEKMHLEVRESNAPARALYAARGYREVGRRPRFYQCPEEDAILMTLFFS